ncbi:hypothetical protein G3R49_07070 [Shewanella sp. WXL01]|uniref:hypothetical protein n=1 Tax=Shewanella sp. WXL01 TaxID=2709721 RepID=UPI001438334B|nr:hypothetical protein [Shewanella sp. WXL01]NKF50334.1 hypothetical protein [Shewanella sp. WXL01]
MTEITENIFLDKVVSFSSNEETLAMKNVTFKTIQNRLFVVGNIQLSATIEDLAHNKACAIAWDSVHDFIIFDSEHEYSQWIEASET